MKDPSGTNAELIAEITALNHKIQELEKSESDRKRAEQEMAIIAEIGRLIGSTLNIDEVYERFAAEARKLISFDRIHVNLKNPYGETFTIAYVSGADIAGRRPGDKVPLAGSITEVLFRTRVGLLFHPASAEEILGRFPGASAATTFRAGMNSIMAVPLISRDEAIGALHFRAKKANAFTERDLRLAERIGMQIAGVIANAQLYSGLRETEKSLRESTAELLATNEKLSREIAEREKAEEALLVSHNELESLVAQRTATLEETNRRLLAEIEARKQSDAARQIMEEALRQTEENFRRSLDESPLGVRIVTVDGDTLYANRAILDIYGYDSVDELRATPVKKRYTPESYAEFKTRFDKRLRGENVPPEYEISIIRKDGEVRRLQAFRRPVLWDGKEQFQASIRTSPTAGGWKKHSGRGRRSWPRSPGSLRRPTRPCGQFSSARRKISGKWRIRSSPMSKNWSCLIWANSGNAIRLPRS